MLLFDLSICNLDPQLQEPEMTKWLGEYVPKLSSSLDILELPAPLPPPTPPN
jgi:hypothetical protein